MVIVALPAPRLVGLYVTVKSELLPAAISIGNTALIEKSPAFVPDKAMFVMLSIERPTLEIENVIGFELNPTSTEPKSYEVGVIENCGSFGLAPTPEMVIEDGEFILLL